MSYQNDEKVDRSSEKTEIGNPIYCSYIDGVYTYKDPTTGHEFVWDEGGKQWKPKKVFGSEVNFNGSVYSYTQNGKRFEWDPVKTAWFTQENESSSSNVSNSGESPNEASSSAGFTNPNYDNSSQSLISSSSQQPRRFYYAALSPSEMGVDEPLLFLSPDDQVNNNSTVSPPEEDEEEEEEDEERVPLRTLNKIIKQASVPLHSSQQLPPGWEKHEDSSGPYFWHIKSGTIQREAPSAEQNIDSGPNPALLIPGSLTSNSFRRSQTISCHLSNSPSFSFSTLKNNLSEGQSSSKDRVESLLNFHPPPDSHQLDKSEKRKSWSQFLENSEREKETERLRESLLQTRPRSESSLRFSAVSLGCLSISEENLTPERSSRAVSKVIAELTTIGPRSVAAAGIEVAGRIWGGGSELYLELDESHLRLKTKDRCIVVGEQPIHSIRVWGVGRDDPRDFAYVAREKTTRQFMCHVFRLETNARPLASALRDACKKIMMERQMRQKRPTTLPTGMRKGTTSLPNVPNFPTPMDEPRKVVKAFYLGTKIVNRATGMETLNLAIDALRANEPIPVSVSVAPSVVLISSDEVENPKVNVEIRVRYLSFMGIGRDPQTCGVIIHTARDEFQAHCFFSNGLNAGGLCKAIEAACVLRYQKCLDAHHSAVKDDENINSPTNSQGLNFNKCNTSPPSGASGGTSRGNNLATAFKNVLASFGRTKSVEEKL